ncbi:hypothetical protein LAUMK191_03104 [Mycobacterium attenuatum]|uniref:Alanine and proline rich membrane protein n=1 Tax=Mycobacterium attenuatum TaxID=2341086 RepID=A0A498Q5R7_9MYCO|nr:hypothetical protein [Mycobacterium attenuatum]VBA39725.1 hypothetical protein LAUMK136_03128 [Mycobacterium attenuatum]VBA54440.1 hypothetical protein LAUMK191_03104 [Mycobacterium attenuatum]
MTTLPPTTGQWTQTHPRQPGTGSRVWHAVGLAIAITLGAAALIVAFTRPTTSGTTARPATSAPPTYTAAEVAVAHQKLCEVYKLAARSVQTDTHGGNQALAGVALVNGAVMLEQAVNAAQALSPADRAAALALADAFINVNAVGSFAPIDDPASQTAINDANAKDARMNALCGAG